MRRVAAIVVTVGAVTGLAGCWPLSGPGSDGPGDEGVVRAFAAGSVAGITEQWTATMDDVGPRGIGHPVVSDRGDVHVASARFVRAFDAATGRPIWMSNPETSTGTFAELDTQLIVRDGWLLTSARLADVTWEPISCDLHVGNCSTVGEDASGRLDAFRSDTGDEPAVLLSQFTPVPGGGTAQLAGPVGAEGTLLTDRPNGSRLTLGPTQVFHAGIGVGTAPGNGVRAFPTAGGTGWVTLVDGVDATSPVLSEDGATVFVGTDTGTLWALSTQDGRVRWTADLGAAAGAAPAVAGGLLYAPTRTGALVVLPTAGCGAATCSPLWVAFTAGAVRVPPAVAAGVVFTGSIDGAVQAYPAGGCGQLVCEAVWSDATGSQITGGPAVGQGQLFVTTMDGRLIAYGMPAA